MCLNWSLHESKQGWCLFWEPGGSLVQPDHRRNRAIQTFTSFSFKCSSITDPHACVLQRLRESERRSRWTLFGGWIILQATSGAPHGTADCSKTSRWAQEDTSSGFALVSTLRESITTDIWKEMVVQHKHFSSLWLLQQQVLLTLKFVPHPNCWKLLWFQTHFSRSTPWWFKCPAGGRSSRGAGERCSSLLINLLHHLSCSCPQHEGAPPLTHFTFA